MNEKISEPCFAKKKLNEFAKSIDIYHFAQTAQSVMAETFRYLLTHYLPLDGK